MKFLFAVAGGFGAWYLVSYFHENVYSLNWEGHMSSQAIACLMGMVFATGIMSLD